MQSVKAFIQRHPVAPYFSLVLLISYGSFLLVVGPRLLRGETMQSTDAEYILFPVIVISVCLAGLAFTSIVNGRSGLRDLFSRIGHWRVDVQWYAVALLTPPVLLLVVLDPAPISPAQETLWYAAYAAVLWIVVALVAVTYGKGLVRQAMQVRTM